MSKNLQNKENVEEMKELSQQNLEIKTIVYIDEKIKNLEKMVLHTTSDLLEREIRVWNDIKEMSDQMKMLFQVIFKLSSGLNEVKEQIELLQSTQSKSSLNVKYRRKKKRIVSLSPSDLDVSGEDIGETDSTRSEDSEPNTEDIIAIIQDTSMKSDESYCPDEDEYEDEFTEESSVEMLSRSIIDFDLEMNEKDEN